jgi:hypothetical protein
MDDFELFGLECEDDAHDVPQTFLHSPKYYVRGVEKPQKAMLLLHENDKLDQKEDYLPIVKAAMGRELIEGHVDRKHEKTSAKHASDDWDFILDENMAL